MDFGVSFCFPFGNNRSLLRPHSLPAAVCGTWDASMRPRPNLGYVWSRIRLGPLLSWNSYHRRMYLGKRLKRTALLRFFGRSIGYFKCSKADADEPQLLLRPLMRVGAWHEASAFSARRTIQPILERNKKKGPLSYQIACTEGQRDHSVDCVRLAAHQQQLLRVLYAAWTGELSFRAGWGHQGAHMYCTQHCTEKAART